MPAPRMLARSLGMRDLRALSLSPGPIACSFLTCAFNLHRGTVIRF